MKNSKKAFTLIELLVVISIISLLAAVVMSTLNGARLKARDVRRAQDLREIQKALAMYYSDHGSYPASSTTCTGDWTLSFKTALVPYMASLPVDPNNTQVDCSSQFVNYYQFANPMTWNAGSKCSNLNNPPQIILQALGELGGRAVVDECGFGTGQRAQSIILN